MYAHQDAAENLINELFERVGLSETLQCLEPKDKLLAELENKLIDTLDDKSKLVGLFLKQAKTYGLLNFLDVITENCIQFDEVSKQVFELLMNNEESQALLIEKALESYQEEIEIIVKRAA